MLQISKTFFVSSIVSGLIYKLSIILPPLDLSRMMMCTYPIISGIGFHVFEHPKGLLSV